MRDRLIRHGLPLAMLAAVLSGGAAGLVTARPFKPVAAPSAEGLPSFGSEEAFHRFMTERRAVVEARRRLAAMRYSDEAVSAMIVPLEQATESITNTQEVGVDEGGIVKASGDHLVVLRRGRLFTFSIAGGGLRAIDRIDVPPPGREASEEESWDATWYDEMLVVDGYVAVIGYSYGKGGTEIIRFRLGADGRLAFHDAYRLAASDYYSEENYASRLIGNELVTYNVRHMYDRTEPDQLLPALTDETPGRPGRTQILARAGEVFIDPNAAASNLAYDSLHSITRCDLTAPSLRCSATAAIGPSSRTFYVSPRAIYLWTTALSGEEGRAPATVYRLPLAGGRPQALRVSGAPLDQFSFREDPERARLDVVVQSDWGGDAMWSRSRREGSVALLSLPLDRFGDGSRGATRSDYRELPGLETGGWQRENRFIGPWLLYAVGNGEDHDGEYDKARGGTLLATRVDRNEDRTFRLPSPASRIEAMGEDALIVSQGPAGLTMTALELDTRARIGATYPVPGTGEAEGRSHGFFFRPDARRGSTGMFGLPILQRKGRTDGLEMLFLRREAGGFSSLGGLASTERGGDDHCRSSCMDWYGQSRPIFLRGRIFALMGYELVEGRVTDGRIREIARVNFMPRVA